MKLLFSWLHSQSITNKVLVFGVIMSTIPLLLISLFYYIQIKEDLEERIIEKHKLITNNLSNEIQLEFNQTFRQMQMFQALVEPLDETYGFFELLQQSDSIEEVVFTNENGYVEKRVSRYKLNLPDGNRETWFSDNMWYAFQTEEQIYGEVEFNEYGQPVMKLAIPFLQDGKRKGIGVVIQLQNIIGQISSLRQEQSAYLYLVDQNGRVIAHQDFSKLWQKNSSIVEDDVIRVKTDIESLGWSLVMEQPGKTAYEPINKMLEKGLIGVALVTLLASLISIYAGLYFTKPIVLLDQAMNLFKVGYKVHPVHLNRRDEIGKLVNSFNGMTSELREKSIELEMEKERLDVVVNSIGAGLALVTKDYEITWMNPRLKEWIGHDKNILSCYKLIGGHNSPCQNCPITCPDLNKGSGNKIMKLRTNQGLERTFRHRVFPLNHAIEEEGEFLLVIEDITEQKEMEEKIVQTDKLTALGLMASSFAHEVNNPLTTINVYAEDLNDRMRMKDKELDSNEMNYYLKKIIENTERCKKITSNLLNFSRKSNWTPGSVDLNETIENSISLVEHTLTKKGIQLQLNIEPDLPFISGDSLKLMQVLVNLINNSVDAMDDKGSLSIIAEKEKDKIVLKITDTGIGIAEGEISKVFDPFYTTKPVGKGTGLGLSVCYGIIQQFGGSLKIESELGKGTAVIIQIPIKEDEQWLQQSF